MRDLPHEVTERLGCYVYLYIDPRDGLPFYVGKGVGNRALSHLDDRAESAKVKRIAQIKRAGREPRIEFLRYGLTNEQATLLEAAVIDAVGLDRLTNCVRGFHEGSFARVTLEDVRITYTAKPAHIKEPALLVIINKLYRSDMSSAELYEATRGVWKIGSRRERVNYAMPVYQGIIREVYRIDRWLPACTLPYKHRDASTLNKSGRWEFEGAIAPASIRDKYLHQSVRHLLGEKNQSPIRYVNA